MYDGSARAPLLVELRQPAVCTHQDGLFHRRIRLHGLIAETRNALGSCIVATNGRASGLACVRHAVKQMSLFDGEKLVVSGLLARSLCGPSVCL